jgi:hypothetical protein
MKSLYEFMESRWNEIRTGRIGVDPQVKNVRIDYLLKKHNDTLRKNIRDYKRSDPSDPHAGNRAATHFRSGIADLDDYGKNRRP